MMLYKLLNSSKLLNKNSAILTLMDSDSFIKENIKNLDIPVYSLQMRKIPSAMSFLRLRKIISDFSPSLIQGWMYHSNLISELCKMLGKAKIPTLWNIRHCVYNLKYEKKSTSMAIRLGAILSTKPKKIIYNSHTSSQQHHLLGYCSEKTVIIPNGFNIENHSVQERKILKVPDDCIIIGNIGRYHPLKDHKNLICAAKEIIKIKPNVKFVLIGRGVDPDNRNLMQMLKSFGIQEYFYLMGEVKDLELLYPEMDFVVQASYSEGFPNVLGESMAAGVPCVATSVGDTEWLIGPSGFLVQPQNPEELAKACIKMIEIGREARLKLGEMARQRIIKNFSINTVANMYENLYLEVLRDK
mgnify:CR=1 FL=1|jgi:Glycosyltransferase